MITTTEDENKIYKTWGVEYTKKYYPEFGMVWRPIIKSPFYFRGKMVVGLNEKFLLEAFEEGIKVFIVKIEKENTLIKKKNTLIEAPDAKTLNKMVKEKRYKDIPSIFKNGKPMRIFYFDI